MTITIEINERPVPNHPERMGTVVHIKASALASARETDTGIFIVNAVNAALYARGGLHSTFCRQSVTPVGKG